MDTADVIFALHEEVVKLQEQYSNASHALDISVKQKTEMIKAIKAEEISNAKNGLDYAGTIRVDDIKAIFGLPLERCEEAKKILEEGKKAAD